MEDDIDSVARWQQVKALFAQAIELEPSSRRAFLIESCGTDQDLRRQVEQLLHDHARAEDFLESPAVVEEAARRGISFEPINAGSLLGPYRIVRELGRGGMGVVYLAERIDGEYERQVAIKLINRVLPDGLLLDRFRQERQILAQLQHPGIAQLLDGGTTDGGQPYLVMEYVQGEWIDLYCKRRGLTIDQRLKLFRRVLDAVHYLHQNLVIHRDLKCSNVLVTAQGEPKLLDFGTAKLLEAETAGLLAQSSPAAVPTASVVLALTPEYASPEQLQGRPVSTASDVYALGVVLFELLTGSRPYALPDRWSPEAVQIVCETTAPRPSSRRLGDDTSLTAAEQHRHRRRLRGDLDNIVGMALQKEPGRRYPSAAQFSEDLRRHLHSQPVLARADTLSYRVGKFVRRHRVGVGAAMLTLVAILGGSIIALESARVARRERAQAAAQRERVEKISAFLVELFEISDPNVARGQPVTAAELLDRGAARIRREMSGQPLDRAALIDAMALAYEKQRLPDQARPLFEEALRLRREHLPPDHLERAQSEAHLGHFLIGYKDYDAAEPHLRTALDLYTTLGQAPAERAEVLDDLSLLASARNQLGTAEALARESLDLRRRTLGANHADVAESLNNLASILHASDRRGEARLLLEQALEMRRRLFGDDHTDVINGLNNLATVLFYDGDLGAAQERFEQALSIDARLFDHDHPGRAQTLDNLAAVLHASGNLEAARQRYDEALVLRRRLLGDDHLDVATGLTNRAALAVDLGQSAEAVAFYREALPILEQALGPSHPSTLYCRQDLAWVTYRAGRAVAAAEMFEPLVSAIAEAFGEDDPELASSRLGLGLAQLEQEQWGAAETQLRAALRIYQSHEEATPWRLGWTRTGLGVALRRQGRVEQAEPLLRAGFDGLVEDAEAPRQAVVMAGAELAQLYRASARPQQAAELEAALTVRD